MLLLLLRLYPRNGPDREGVGGGSGVTYCSLGKGRKVRKKKSSRGVTKNTEGVCLHAGQI